MLCDISVLAMPSKGKSRVIKPERWKWVWVYGIYRHFQQHFSYIVVVSFVDGGNRSTKRKPPNCRKSLTKFIT